MYTAKAGSQPLTLKRERLKSMTVAPISAQAQNRTKRSLDSCSISLSDTPSSDRTPMNFRKSKGESAIRLTEAVQTIDLRTEFHKGEVGWDMVGRFEADQIYTGFLFSIRLVWLPVPVVGETGSSASTKVRFVTY